MRRLGASVIADTESVGTPVSLADMDSITVIPPAAFTGVITLEISGDNTQNWVDVTSGGSTVLVVDGESLTLTKIHGTHVRVGSNMAEAAERIVQIFGSRGK